LDEDFVMQNDVEFRNAVRLEDGRYDCEIQHPVFGWIPFTADPNDVEGHGRAIWAAIEASQ
jgi:hypothetical protein